MQREIHVHEGGEIVSRLGSVHYVDETFCGDQGIVLNELWQLDNNTQEYREEEDSVRKSSVADFAQSTFRTNSLKSLTMTEFEVSTRFSSRNEICQSTLNLRQISYERERSVKEQ